MTIFDKLQDFIELIRTDRLEDLFKFRKVLIDHNNFIQRSYVDAINDGIIDNRDNSVPAYTSPRLPINEDLVKLELIRNLIIAVSQTIETITNTVNTTPVASTVAPVYPLLNNSSLSE